MILHSIEFPLYIVDFSGEYLSFACHFVPSALLNHFDSSVCHSGGSLSGSGGYGRLFAAVAGRFLYHCRKIGIPGSFFSWLIFGKKAGNRF